MIDSSEIIKTANIIMRQYGPQYHLDPEARLITSLVEAIAMHINEEIAKLKVELRDELRRP